MPGTCSRSCTDMMDTVQGIPQPVIARVHGLATAAGLSARRHVRPCDRRRSRPAFAIPGGKGGLFCHTPVVAVSRSIGRKRALEMALTGDSDRRRHCRRLGPGQPRRSRRRTRRSGRRPDRTNDRGAARCRSRSASAASTSRSASTSPTPTRSPSTRWPARDDPRRPGGLHRAFLEKRRPNFTESP